MFIQATLITSLVTSAKCPKYLLEDTMTEVLCLLQCPWQALVFKPTKENAERAHAVCGLAAV